jgi:hypothetical protein
MKVATAVLAGDVLTMYLYHNHLVGHVQERVATHINFALTGGGDLWWWTSTVM